MDTHRCHLILESHKHDLLPALQSDAGGIKIGSGGFQCDGARNRGGLKNRQATTLKGAVLARFAVFNIVQVTVANTNDAGRPGYFKCHFGLPIGNANTVLVHDPEFNVADILAIGAHLGLRGLHAPGRAAARHRRLRSDGGDRRAARSVGRAAVDACRG